MITRSAHIVDGLLALRSARATAAMSGAIGREILTLPLLAGRLAGGFTTPAGTDVLYPAIQAALAVGGFRDIAGIAGLPGMPRAVLQSLDSVWRSDLDLASLAHEAVRFHDLALIEARIRESLPATHLLPRDLRDAAVKRADYTRSRAPTNELTKAHTNLRQRRHIAASSQDWRNSTDKVTQLLGRRISQKQADECRQVSNRFDPENEFDIALKSISEAVSRSDAVLAHINGDTEQLSYENALRSEKIAGWLNVVAQTDSLPPTLAAVITEDAWTEIEPMGFDRGEGRLMAAALLKLRRKTTSHPALWSVGARTVSRSLRRDQKPIIRYTAGLTALRAGADEGLRRHQTWLAAKRLLERKVRGRRSTSHLPALIDLLVARPLVSASMISKELHVSHRAALGLIAELEVREMTGRDRFRAWGIS